MFCVCFVCAFYLEACYGRGTSFTFMKLLNRRYSIPTQPPALAILSDSVSVNQKLLSL